MKIGRVAVPNKVALAPMAGVTDKAFRLIAREHGCGLVYTEMVSAKALTYNNTKTKTLFNLEGERSPLAVQIFGAEPEVMAAGACLVQEEGADIIDINMGCPVPKVVKNLEGSALLERPDLAAAIVQAVVKAVDLPVTVKIRLGWNKDNIVAVEFARRMEEAGAAGIAVHGRTRDQYYSGQADWETIGLVKQAISIPVIGNGDIWTPRDALRMIEGTGCDGVMIGRGALGNPWLISRTLRLMQGGEEQPPSPTEKIRGALEHLALAIEFKGEAIGVREMRKHLTWYLKGLPHTAPLKEAIYRIKTHGEIVFLLEKYLKKLEAEA